MFGGAQYVTGTTAAAWKCTDKKMVVKLLYSFI